MSVPTHKRADQKGLTVVLVAATAMAALAACSNDGNDSGAPKDSSDLSRFEPAVPKATNEVDKVVWASSFPPIDSLDPARAFDVATRLVLENVCEPLVGLDADGKSYPLLAESIDTSEDGMTVTIDVRPNITFSDGSAMTAADVAFSLNRMRDPNVSFDAGSLSRITSVKESGPLTVVVELSRPDALLVPRLTGPAGVVVSKKNIEQAETSFGSPQAELVCTGPYALGPDGWSAGQPITLLRNDSYWNPDLKPLVREIEFQFITDTSTLTNALKTGEIDGSFQVSGAAIAALDSADGKVYYAPGIRPLQMMAINPDSAFGDVKVRQALSLAIDRTQIADGIWNGTAEPLRAAAPRSSWVSAESTFTKAWEDGLATTGEPDKATELVAAYSGSKTIRIAVPADYEDYVRLCETVQAVAKQIGLTVELDAMPTASYGKLFSDPAARANYDAIFAEIPMSIPDPLDLYINEASGSSFYNYLGYDNPEVTSLLDAASEESDAQQRAALTVQIQKILNTDLPWIPIVSPDITMFLSDELGGDVLTSNAYYPFAAHLGGM
jgi:peptide/nickel transport system substrate-binding protein